MYVREFTQDIRQVKGVGPRISGILDKLGIRTVAGLLLHFPRDYIDRSRIDTLKEALSREYAHVAVTVIAHDYVGWGYKKALKVYIKDDSAQGALVCYGRNFLESVLIPGKEFLVSGIFHYRFHEIQSSNFEIEPLVKADDSFRTILPVYPLTEGISQGYMRKIILSALDATQDKIDDELPISFRSASGFPSKADALRTVHFPENIESLKCAKEALIFEELFYLQLLIARRSAKKRITRQKRKDPGSLLAEKIIRRLPFSLTPDQEKVIAGIRKDLFSDAPMSRLVQGDVGCGKTLVALISASFVIESGEQAAFLAPTELLARQHAENIARLVEPAGIRVALVSGTTKTEARKHISDAVSAGEIDLLIGTHALFSGDINFRKLGLVIVDEQHRFGVLQRITIMRKGENPDLLLMTATPIPRTLALTAFGDLDVSAIKTVPAGRKPVITHLAKEGNEHKVYKRIREEVAAGRQAYFVYPLIEESEKSSLKDAESMFVKLEKEVFPDFRLGLIHSRVKEADKERIMEDFVRNRVQILVATSVVEVGVDVANANCIVIEHAERFGLSALHQLRGRVGRGLHQSYAFLVYSEKLTDDGIRRLKVMMETHDGFRIAEEDLNIRGPGELLGVKQSGFMKLTIANLARDLNILEQARKTAFTLFEQDPGLIDADHQVIRDVLSKAPPFPDELLDGG